jgi:hypothetical protein
LLNESAALSSKVKIQKEVDVSKRRAKLLGYEGIAKKEPPLPP